MVSPPSRITGISQLDKPEADKPKAVEKDPDDYYRMPAEEDMYVPPGRKFYDREELCPKEEQIELGPPILQND